jgi:hypothetical protein
MSALNDVRYTIWHLDTGNLIGDFATESAALAAVRGEIQANASPDALVLQRERTGGDSEFVASGSALASLAFRHDHLSPASNPSGTGA